MMINFSKFVKEQEASVPVLNRSFSFNRKKFQLDKDVEDGWYKVKIRGNLADFLEEIIPADSLINITAFKMLRGYVYNNSIIFQNFDVAKRHTGIEMQAPLHLNTASTFSSVLALFYEDKNFYMWGSDYSDLKIFDIKAAYDKNIPGSLDEVKGITPELRTLYLFHDLQRQQLLAQQKALLEKKAKDEWLKSIPGRLTSTFTNAGATVLDFSTHGKYLVVNWRLDSSKQEFNSLVDAETFKIAEAGYCMSGDDKKHSITSMIKLAEVYNENRRIYQTRFAKDNARIRGPHLDANGNRNDDWWRDEQDWE